MTDRTTIQEGRRTRILSVAIPTMVLLFLLQFAARFADERLYSDSGYYLARVINEHGFWIEHGRWVLGLYQELPLLGTWFGIPMTGLIHLHSLNNILWLAACMAFAGLLLRDRNILIALASVHLIGLTHGLFCPIFELYYGVDLLILFHGVCQSGRLEPIVRWILLIIFFIVILSSHFFALVLVLGSLVMARIWREHKLTATLIGIGIAHLALKRFTITTYEKTKLDYLADFGNVGAMTELFTPARLSDLLGYLATHYPDVVVLLVAAIVMLGRSRRIKPLLVLLVGLFVIHVLTGLYLPGFEHDRYREQMNFATTAWILMIFCSCILPMERWRPIALSLLAMAVVFRMAGAEWIAPRYTARTAQLEKWIEQAHAHHLSKAIVNAPMEFGSSHHNIDLSWSASVESLLLSAKAGPGSTVSLITTQDLEFGDVRQHLDRFIFRRWDLLDPAWLDPRYFKAPIGMYLVLPPSAHP